MERTMTETIVASRLDPTEVILEDTVEIRPCLRCRCRLLLPIEDVGRTVGCPSCGYSSRALPVAGPFADVHIERSSVNLSTGSVSAQETTRTLTPMIAPFVPIKKQDPIEERSAMVNTIGAIQWIASMSLTLVALNQTFLYWTSIEWNDKQERAFVTVVGFCLLNAFVLVLCGFGIRHRSWHGWGFGILCSLVTVTAVGFVLYQRSVGMNGRFADVHYGILFSLPAFLCGITTIVILLTPRYLAEFRQAGGSGYAGTM
jgi:hypothetical protein